MIILILILVLGELISYLIIPDSKLDTLELISKVLNEDPLLFWKQRQNLNTKFQGVSVTTNSLGLRDKEIKVKKDSRTFRIFCLGASPTFGWGVDFQHTYPYLLEQKLKRNKSSMNFEVINAGQIGYTTYQGIIFLEKYLLKYSPDLVTVPYILNDIDRYKFFRNNGLSDRELRKGNTLIIGFKNILARSRLIVLLKRVIYSLIDKNKRIKIFILKKQFNLAKVRVSKEDYKENLEKFRDVLAKHNIRIIFIKIPVNLSLPSLSDEERQILNSEVRLSDFYYGRGCIYEKRKEYEKSQFFLKKAKDYLVLDCYQDRIVYQNLMTEVANKYKAPLIDAVAIFQNEGKTENLFNSSNDPIHPNAKGHEIIAEALYSEIIQYNLF